MASPIAHSFAGFSIYWIMRRSGQVPVMPFRTRRFLVESMAAIILANLSDLDILAGVLFNRYLHHQLTHTFAFALFIGISAALFAPVFQPVRRLRAFSLATVLTGSHIVIDYFTKDTSVPKGCMLFWPISENYFMFPIHIFVDIWRMSPALLFGFNNINAAIRESAIGSAMLLLAISIRPWPKPIRKPLCVFTMVTGLTAILADRPLSQAAEQQLLEYLGHYKTQLDSPSKTVGGILFSAISGGNRDIFVVQPDGSDRRQLTINPADDDWPTWSPKADWIAFQSDRSGNMDIWIMSPDGMNKRNLTERSAATDETPSWTPAGNQIVFCSHRSGQPCLYVMNLDGTGIKEIAGDTAGRKLMPSVSPVSETVAYTGDPPLFPGWNIYSVSLNGGSPKRISPSSGCRAKWSPDGNYMVYVAAGTSNTSDLYVFNISGGPHRRLTHSPEQDYDPCFSPDGRFICFCRSVDERKTGWDLWILDQQTGVEERMTSDGGDNRNPSWR